jgi:hypothetical protein
MSQANHEHKRAERFEFSAARNTAVFVCTRVRDGAPVLHVSHDSHGDWQFLCGDQHGDGQSDRPLLVCLECVVADDLTLNELSDLCADWTAERDHVSDVWRRHDNGEDFIVDAVARCGWAVELIEAGSEESQPSFAYTVGLHKSFDAPELIVAGLPHDVMHRILNALGERIKAGEALPVGEPISGIIDGYPVRLREVKAQESYREHVGYALWFNGGYNFPLLQVLWPDKQGHFPGDSDADAATARVQLGMP